MSEARRSVLVTGGGTGIGRVIAATFLNAGDAVAICGRRADVLEATAQELSKERCLPLPGDVSNPDAVDRMVDTVCDRHGRLDVLVNSAGIYGPVGPFHQADPRAWLENVTINLHGVFLTCQAVVAPMAAQGGGTIINLSGGGATTPKPRYSAYAAAKAGVVRFTEILAHELADKNIRAHAIAPGFIATDFHQATLDAGDAAGDADKVRQKIESGGDDPQKAADLALFLAGSEAADVSGRIWSAIWDDWKNPETLAALKANPSLYTLRRIDDALFTEVKRT